MHTATVGAFRDELRPTFIQVVLAGVEWFVSDPDRRGVRRDAQERLVAAGYNVRVYVPYGAQWYPYLVRRLAERPANLAFVLGAVARDSRRSPA